MECQNCQGSNGSLTKTWLKKFPGVTYCAYCVREEAQEVDDGNTDIEQECTRCGEALCTHHQSECPVCNECRDWCGHLIAYSPELFTPEGPKLIGWKNSKSIDRLIEAHEEYEKAYWEARERLADDEQFLARWNDLQDKHKVILKAVYGENWKFEDHDLWERDECDSLLALLGDLEVLLVDTEGDGAPGTSWESQNVYVDNAKAAMKIANQNADRWAGELRGITKQVASL